MFVTLDDAVIVPQPLAEGVFVCDLDPKGEREFLDERVTLVLAVELECTEDDAEGQPDDDDEGESDSDAVGDSVPNNDLVCPGVAETDGEFVVVDDPEDVGDRETILVMLGEFVVETERDVRGDALDEMVAEGDNDADGDCDGEIVGLGEDEGERLSTGERLEDPEPETVTDVVLDGDNVPDTVDVEDTEGLLDPLDEVVDVTIAVGEAQADAEREAVDEIVPVTVTDVVAHDDNVADEHADAVVHADAEPETVTVEHVVNVGVEEPVNETV